MSRPAKPCKVQVLGGRAERGLETRLAEEDVNQITQDSRSHDHIAQRLEKAGTVGEAAWNIGLVMWSESRWEGSICLLSKSVESQTVGAACLWAHNT